MHDASNASGADFATSCFANDFSKVICFDQLVGAIPQLGEYPELCGSKVEGDGPKAIAYGVEIQSKGASCEDSLERWELLRCAPSVPPRCMNSVPFA